MANLFVLSGVSGHRNKKIFRNQPDPQKIVHHQKAQFHWIAKAFQEETKLKPAFQTPTPHPQHLQITVPTLNSNPEARMMILEVKKDRDVEWFGTSAMNRSPTGFCMVSVEVTLLETTNMHN